jgi:hypothetical protein
MPSPSPSSPFTPKSVSPSKTNRSNSRRSSSEKAARAYASISAQLSQFQPNNNGHYGLDLDLNLDDNANADANADSISISMATRNDMEAMHEMGTMNTSTVKPVSSLLLFQQQPPQQQVEKEQNGNDNDNDSDNNNDDDRDQPLFQYNVESLDGDYRPYFDALKTLVQSASTPPSSSSNNNNNNSSSSADSKARLQSHVLQYMNRIMRYNYDRSTIIQQQDDDMEYVNVTTQLEKEGHFWSLLIHLLEFGVYSTSSSNRNEEEHEKHVHDDHDAMDFLLWKHDDTHYHGEKQIIHDFIHDLVTKNSTLDSATMVQSLQSYFEVRSQQQQDDTNYTSSSSSTLPLPLIVKRRQIILGWIESCHNRSVMGYTSTATNNNGIMWKDTISNFKSGKVSITKNDFDIQQQQQNTSKITCLHPDAPNVVRFQQQQQQRNQYSPQQPLPLPLPLQSQDLLHGKDGANETYMLSTCLSLIKAGRFNDALECCKEYGQHWRIAVWDGNAPFGHQTIFVEEEEEESMMIVDNDEVHDDHDHNIRQSRKKKKKKIRIGNPQRSLWKRSLWNASATMQSLITTQLNGGEKQTITSGSFIYEAAISAILADDVKTALMNPILKRNWMDLIWVYYRGKQSRFTEEVICTHNAVRRMNKVSNDEIIEGAEFEKEEKEQLADTEEIGLMDDVSFLSHLEEECTKKVEDDIDVLWRPGICAFLSKMNDVEAFLVKTIQSILQDANKEALNDDDHQQEVSLRFMYHLIFFLDLWTSNDGSMQSLRDNVITPYIHELLQLYLKRLMKHHSLWKFTCLYASMLPMDAMIDELTNFWVSSIHDDHNRRLMLNQAREYLSEGLDLVILREVVRAGISITREDVSIGALPSTIMKRIMSGSAASALVQKISKDDWQKMHTIHWLCMNDEHLADALVCSNILLRQFLLGMDQEEDSNDISDWEKDVKLCTAKTFISKLLPLKFVQKARDGGGINTTCDDINANKMCMEEFVDQVQEFEAIHTFLQAHSSYEAWKEMVVIIPAHVEFHSNGNYKENSLEHEIAMKMDKRNYIQKKRKNGLALIKAAELAYQRMMELLVVEGGFMVSRPSEAGVVFPVDELQQRIAEKNELRGRIIPNMVFLTYQVLKETAGWMSEFIDDISSIFGNDAQDVLSRINLVHVENEINPFVPQTWYSKTLNLADVIKNNSNNKSCFSADDWDYLESLMTEANAFLKHK